MIKILLIGIIIIVGTAVTLTILFPFSVYVTLSIYDLIRRAKRDRKTKA